MKRRVSCRLHRMEMNLVKRSYRNNNFSNPHCVDQPDILDHLTMAGRQDRARNGE
jgi:hypothetical protein